MTTFTKPELELIEKALDDHTPYSDEIGDLHTAVLRAIEGPIRGKLATVAKGSVLARAPLEATVLDKSDDNDPAYEWLNDCDELLRAMMIDENGKLLAKREQGKAIERYIGQLEVSLAGLKDIERIKSENERLMIELAASGPVEDKEELELLKQRYAGALQQTEVHKRQVDSLRGALRAERLDRQALESQGAFRTEIDHQLPAAKAMPLLPPSDQCRNCREPIDEVQGEIFCSSTCGREYDRKTGNTIEGM